MSPGRPRWSLGSLLLLLGGTLAVHVQIHQGSINGTVGQPVLLPVSYRFDGAPRFPVSILWTFGNSTVPLITCTLKNCSVGAGRVPSGCSENCFSHDAYRGRAELFPKNGSLLLRGLQLSDSGIYNVTFRPGYQSQQITLTVHEQRFTPEPPAGTAHDLFYKVGIGVGVLLLLLLLGLVLWIRRRAQQKRRPTKEPQVSRVVESHAVGDMVTVYATVGDAFEQPPTRPTPEVVYSSIMSLDPPRPHTGPSRLRC